MFTVTDSGTRFIVEVHNYSIGTSFLNRLQIYSAQSLVDAWRKIGSQRGKRYVDVPNVRTLAFIKVEGGMEWLHGFRFRNGIHHFSFAHIDDNEFVKADFLQDYMIVDLVEARRSLSNPPSSINGNELIDWLTFLTRNDQEEVTLLANPSDVLLKAYFDASNLNRKDIAELEREKVSIVDYCTVLDESEKRGKKRGKKRAIELVSSNLQRKGFTAEEIIEFTTLSDDESDIEH